MEILALKNLSFTYPGSQKKALSGVSLTVERGDFVALIGPTGSGKSTLLRMIKPFVAPRGEMSGEITICGEPVSGMNERTAAGRIGFVMQRPEEQTVCDKVWHELAFGLENLGLASDTIRRRTAEVAGWLGLDGIFEEKVSRLSGGQKQLLNLASVLVMQPEILLLDEPLSQLDPAGGADFLCVLEKLCRELSLTVIIAEHRLENVLPLCDKVAVLEDGKLAEYGSLEAIAPSLCSRPAVAESMPTAARLFYSLGELAAKRGACPLTVREGRAFIENNFGNAVRSLDSPEYSHSDEAALEFRDVFFRYSRECDDVLHGVDFTVYCGEIFCILGKNASGKTTALSAAAGLIKPYAGKIKVFSKDIGGYKGRSLYQSCVAMLMQDPQLLFLCDTVKDELADASDALERIPYDFTGIMERHPYDLSGGEAQMVALAKAVSASPRLLLLDECTKGLDSRAKLMLIGVLNELRRQGITIVAVTHDVEFASRLADRCAMLFRGELVSCAPTAEFFSENSFYTTCANIMTRGYYDSAVTLEDVLSLCRLNTRKELCNDCD